jgi:hypothetical protein
MPWIASFTDTPQVRVSAACRRVIGRRVGRPVVNACLYAGMATLLLLTGQSALADTLAPNERELHTAECVAALDVKSDAVARHLKAGQAELRPVLEATLEAGAAFIGHAYLQGDRDEARSQGLLNAALQAQKDLSETELAARQSSCAVQGTRLLSQTDFIGRAIVARLVQRRMQKLIGE